MLLDIVRRREVWRSSVILRSHLLVLVASSDVLLDIIIAKNERP